MIRYRTSTYRTYRIPQVFTPLYMWPQILDEMATTERELMARYDLVLVLHTAPEFGPFTNSQIPAPNSRLHQFPALQRQLHHREQPATTRRTRAGAQNRYEVRYGRSYSNQNFRSRYAEVWQEHHRVIEIEANRENGMEEKFGDVWAQLEQLMNCD